jgi:hypothetical protein
MAGYVLCRYFVVEISHYYTIDFKNGVENSESASEIKILKSNKPALLANLNIIFVYAYLMVMCEVGRMAIDFLVYKSDKRKLRDRNLVASHNRSEVSLDYIGSTDTFARKDSDSPPTIKKKKMEGLEDDFAISSPEKQGIQLAKLNT